MTKVDGVEQAVRRRRLRARDRRDPRLPGEGDHLRDRRLRQDLQDDVERAHPHGRRRRHHLAQGPPARGHGVLPVPPDRPRRARHPAHRGRARRGCDPAQRERRALHGALRADHQGPRARATSSRAAWSRRSRRAAAPGRTRTTSTSTARTSAPRCIETKLPDITEFARTYLGVDPVTEPVPVHADRALRDGRHPDQRQGRGAVATTTPSCPASTRPASAPASPCTARTVSARTRCSTSTSSASAPATTPSSTSQTVDFTPLPDDPAGVVTGLIEQLRDSTGTERIATIRKELQDEMDDNAQVFRTDESLDEVTDRSSTTCASGTRTSRSRTRASASTPTSSRRSSWASCSTSPRSSSTPRATARRAAAVTCATTSRSATTRTT